MKDLFSRYLEDPNVQLIVKGMKILVDESVKLGKIGFDNYNELDTAYFSNVPDSNIIFRKEKKHQLNPPKEGGVSVKCPGGDKCGCSSNELFGGLGSEFHHVLPDGPAKKKECIDASGNVKQPFQYDEDDWDEQRPFVELVCRFYHRLVDLVENEGDKNTVKYRRIVNMKIRDALTLYQSGGGCFVTKRQVGENEMRAFDNHHLAMELNLLFGNVLLVVKKYSELSLIVMRAKDFGDLIENLFPEVIITRLVDCRVHILIHYLIKWPSLLDRLGGDVFPFELDTVDDETVWRYTGPELETFAKMGKCRIELPSVAEMFGVSDLLLLCYLLINECYLIYSYFIRWIKPLRLVTKSLRLKGDQ